MIHSVLTEDQATELRKYVKNENELDNAIEMANEYGFLETFKKIVTCDPEWEKRKTNSPNENPT